MNHRKNWILADGNNLSNFSWKYSTKGVCYNRLSEVKAMDSIDKFKAINVFEGHNEISNKRKLFMNLKEYCDVLFYINKYSKTTSIAFNLYL